MIIFILVSAVSMLIGAIIGYKLCMIRNLVKPVLKALSIQTAFVSGEISAEEALKQYKKLEY